MKAGTIILHLGHGDKVNKLKTSLAMALSLLFLCPFNGGSAGQKTKQQHPLSIQLESLLGRIRNTRDPSKISKSTADSLVRLTDWIENVAKMDTIDGFDSKYESFSNVDLIYPALDKLVNGARKRDYLIKTIIKLELIINRNVELAESMPEYVQRVASDNTAGFLRVLRQFTEKERVRILSALGWPSKIDVRAVFNNFASKTKNSKLKAEAQYITGAVGQEEFEKAEP